MNGFDNAVFHALNQFAGQTPVVDPTMTLFAEYSPVLYALIFIVGWFSLPREETAMRHGLVMGFCAGLLAFGVNTIIGALWYRPRPFAALPPGTFHKIIPYAADASFPSDHVALGFGFASGAMGGARRWVTLLFMFVTLVVMVARVYVGVHWPTDVLGGMVIGIACGRAIQPLSLALSHVTDLLLRVFRMGRHTKR